MHIVLILSIFYIEKNGKTIHLLKQNAKSYQGSKKRKKVPLLGSIGQYKSDMDMIAQSQEPSQLNLQEQNDAEEAEENNYEELME